MTKLTNEELLDKLVRTMPLLSFPDDYSELRAEILQRMAEGAAGEASLRWLEFGPNTPPRDGEYRVSIKDNASMRALVHGRTYPLMEWKDGKWLWDSGDGDPLEDFTAEVTHYNLESGSASPHGDLLAALKAAGEALTLITNNHQIPGAAISEAQLDWARATRRKVEVAIDNFKPGSASTAGPRPDKFTVLDEGHDYLLRSLDGDKPVRLTFVKRCLPAEKFPGNHNAYPGTTSQDVRRALINRARYVDGQIGHPVNQRGIQRDQQTIYELEQRAAERHGRTLTLSAEEIARIELLETCGKCGHIFPENHSECEARFFAAAPAEDTGTIS